MKYTAVIFDLDGVIHSTDQYHFQAWKTIAERLQVPFDEHINNRLRGVSRQDSLEIVLEPYRGQPLTPQQKKELAGEKNEIYRRLLAKMTSEDASGEVIETLDTLRSMGLQLAIGSSSRNARFILGQLGLGEYFDAVADGSEISHSKPNPEVFLLATHKLEQMPQNCLVVEDAEAGVKAALSGGFDCAGIGQAAQATGVTFAIESVCELPGIIKCS